MKKINNLTFYFLIVPLLQYQFVLADAFYPVSATIPLEHQCPQDSAASRVNPSTMRIMGERFASQFTVEACVLADSVNEARRICAPLAFLNPANPQYLSVDQVYSPRSAPSSYYYCISGAHESGRPISMAQIKNDICNQMISRYEQSSQIAFNWTGREGEDGSCKCRAREGGRGAWGPWRFDCPNERETRLAREEIRLSVISAVELAAIPAIDLSSSLPTIEVPPVPNYDEMQTKLTACIARWREKSDTCTQNAEQARTTCSGENVQSEESGQQGGGARNVAADIAGALGQAVVGSRAGSGSQQTCFQAGAATYAAQEALTTTRNDCQERENTCNASCSVNQADAMETECISELGGYENIAGLRQYRYTDFAQELETAKTNMTTKLREGATVCAGIVRAQRSDMDRVATGIGQALQASTICACKNSSTSNGMNCDQIPTITTCQTNPQAPGCTAYVPVSTCAIGTAGYNAQACACLQNPSSPTCRSANAPAVPTFASGFGGGLPQVSGGASGFAGGMGGGASGGTASAGNFDLSGGAADSTGTPLNQFASNLKPGDTGGGSGGQMGGSVGGGGGGGGGGGSGSAANTAGLPNLDKKEEGGIKGMFNQLKTSVSNALGLGNSNSRRPVANRAGLNKQPSMEKFRPNIRGAAPLKREIASANEKTLFELINECANGLRCKSNKDSTNWIVDP